MTIINRDDADPDSRAQWDALGADTARAMQEYGMRFITPISYSTSDDVGFLAGTGAYVEYGGQRYLLTNEHVVSKWRSLRYGHQLLGCEDVFRVNKAIALEGDPVDAAICIVDDQVWSSHSHAAASVPSARVASKHDPVPGELLFLYGYPQARSGFTFGTLISIATPLITQAPVPEAAIAGLHPNYFLLEYPVGKARSVDPNSSIPLSLPPGLSGSLVWNTRRVECLRRGIEWTPEHARVTGLLCSWIEAPPRVVAIRSEVLLDFLRRRTARPYWWGHLKAGLSQYLRKLLLRIRRHLRVA